MNQHPFQTSIGKKQIVAVTGLMLVIFLIGHLAGNLFIYWGEDAFNHYAEKLANLRPGLLIVEAGLLVVFLTHITFTTLVVLENIKARPQGYCRQRHVGRRSLSSRIMPLTATILFAFVITHLLDFTFVDKHGSESVLWDGESHGLFGIVVNAFMNPFQSLFYVAAMISLGYHLSHGVQSCCQTLGWNHPRYTPMVLKFSRVFAVAMSLGFSLIPIYIYWLYGSM